MQILDSENSDSRPEQTPQQEIIVPIESTSRSTTRSGRISVPPNWLMSLIHYSFTPLILFCVSYTLDLLLYYLSIANGTGGVGIFELLVFQCFV